MKLAITASNGELEKPTIANWSDSLRRLTPLEIQCQMFCGGKKCKYEGPANWEPDQMAINGIFSNWITCNILAMARPNTEQIMKYNIIEQFKRSGIRSIINLQQAGEHGSCGCGLESGGFSYNSSDFMNNEIYFYNFPWRDYGVASLEAINDVMKVISFALLEGKLAVHCHAGLGRTGVLIACYLIYRCRITGNSAIRYVRIRRPNSIQTRLQVATVIQFENYIWPSFSIISRRFDDEEDAFTLEEYLRKQDKIHHGYEARLYKYLPKVIHHICERLLKLGGLKPIGVIDDNNKDTFWKNFICVDGDDLASTPMTPATPSSSTGSTFFPPFYADSAHADSGLISTDNSDKTPRSSCTNQYDECLTPSTGSTKSSKKLTAGRVRRKGKRLLKSIKHSMKSTASGKKKEPPIDEEEREKQGTSSHVGSFSESSSIADYSDDSLSDTDDESLNTPTSSYLSRTTSGMVSPKTKFFISTDSLPTPLKVESDEEAEYVSWSFRRSLNKDPDEELESDYQLSETDVPMERLVTAQTSFYSSQEHLIIDEELTVQEEEIFYATLPTKSRVPSTTDIVSPKQIASALIQAMESTEMDARVDEFIMLLNKSNKGWDLLNTVNDPVFLADLLYIWLDQLKQPVLSKQDLTTILACNYLEEPTQCLHKLTKSTRVTFEYFLRFINRIQPISDAQKNNAIRQLIRGLTQNNLEVAINNQLIEFINALLPELK